MTRAAFERLLSPGAIGTLELRNRIALCPMGVNLGEPDGSVGDAITTWFEVESTARFERGCSIRTPP